MNASVVDDTLPNVVACNAYQGGWEASLIRGPLGAVQEEMGANRRGSVHS